MDQSNVKKLVHYICMDSFLFNVYINTLPCEMFFAEFVMMVKRLFVSTYGIKRRSASRRMTTWKGGQKMGDLKKQKSHGENILIQRSLWFLVDGATLDIERAYGFWRA